jgi:hypothetical protein
MFHALELRCHAARTNARVLDRLGARLYGWFSDYGQSMARPIGWLAVCWFAVASIYFGVFSEPGAIGQRACDVPKNWSRVGELIVAAGRQFLPSLFTPAAGVSSPPDWLKCVAKQHEVMFFFVSLGQTLFFIACVTLFLIALRRRFRLHD